MTVVVSGKSISLLSKAIEMKLVEETKCNKTKVTLYKLFISLSEPFKQLYTLR